MNLLTIILARRIVVEKTKTTKVNATKIIKTKKFIE